MVGLTSVYQFQEVQWVPEGRTVSGTADFGSIEITAPVVLGSGFDYRQAYAAAVPEPQGMALFGSGLLVLLGVWRRRSLRPGRPPVSFRA